MKVLKIKRMNAGRSRLITILLNELISGYFRIIDARRLGQSNTKDSQNLARKKFNIENLLCGEIFAMRRICRIIYIQH